MQFQFPYIIYIFSANWKMEKVSSSSFKPILHPLMLKLTSILKIQSLAAKSVPGGGW